jgi:hypothetical protein
MIGIERGHHMLASLPMNTLKAVDGAEDVFMTFVQKSSKLRAPRFSGQLAESIHKYKISFGKWELSVDSPYGWFQEVGWQARPLSAFTPSRSGYLVWDWMQGHGFSGGGVTPLGEPHPFVTPAFESGMNALPTIMQNAVFKAAKESL